MAWIANREIIRKGDIVYSLFGIFDVHMPIVYAENALKASPRLGGEIEKQLAW
jgi:hypothetical protein